MPETGKVILVGAGPGDPDLLTVRAVQRIGSGDVIVYDRLVQERVLALAKPTAEKIFMGKPQGHHVLQDEIHTLLVEKAREGKTVIRLKGGDPFLFGRGGEEVEYLAEHGVPFEVVPGISSCLSAPLGAGIAVTHRAASSSVAIVTGHNADGNGDRVNWQALAGIDTLVFLMCVHHVETITRKLMAAGRSSKTPAAMIQMAWWDGERVITGTLENIAAEVCREGIEPPATLVVGEAVCLREKLRQLVASNQEQREVCV
jgi:uroporphyrin-III C-methyltransferase